MKNTLHFRFCLITLALGWAISAHAVTRYVSLTGGNTAPYTNWAQAATSIQTAINASSASDLILVTNGVYDTGGVTNYPQGSGLTNRVAIHKRLKVQSVNGPAVTFIAGAADSLTVNGEEAVRCVYITNGASLVGFTLTNGHTRAFEAEDENDGFGGGAWCMSASSAVISNCVIAGSSADNIGGGIYKGAIYNSTLQGNSAFEGGGAGYALLNNCMLMGNTAVYGAGAFTGTLYSCTLISNTSSFVGGGAYEANLFGCTLTGNSAEDSGGGAIWGGAQNCIVYYNTALDGANYYGTTNTRTCTTPLPAGSGNISNDPRVVSISNPRLLANSPCINAGVNQSWMSGASDRDGESRLNGTVDMGSDEMWTNGLTGAIGAAIYSPYSTIAAGFATPLQSLCTGKVQKLVWQFGDGQSVTNFGVTTHAFATAGTFSIVLAASNLSGNAAATTVIQVIDGIFVATNGNDVSSGLNWSDAKRSIQAGVDAAALVAGCPVIVSNGLYNSGGVAGYPQGGLLTNRVAIHSPLTVRSLNGPGVTTIAGAADPATTNGNAAVRCVYLTNGASLVGFCLTNGHSRSVSGDDGMGGGAISDDGVNAVLSNCVVRANAANDAGGGVARCVLYDSVLAQNFANVGGGSYNSALHNCNLTANSANDGGGVYNGSLDNCIVYYNASGSQPNYDSVASLTKCCTTPLAPGTGNFTNEPLLVGLADAHVLPNSPCVNAGTNLPWMSNARDFDGEFRTNGNVDVGADEVWPATLTGTLSAVISASRTVIGSGNPVAFQSFSSGQAQGFVWKFDDGQRVTNQIEVSHSFTGVGPHDVLLTVSNLAGAATATLTVYIVDTIYVSTNGNDAASGATWATAKKTIQAGVNAAAEIPGTVSVLVTNGVYDTGGAKDSSSQITNRVAIHRPLTVRSVNGPLVTFIAGAPDPFTTNGNAAIRCVYMTNGSSLCGFTLTNGHTGNNGGDSENGAGVLCAYSQSATVSNCILTGNTARNIGGGAYSVSLYDCTLDHNVSLFGGGAMYCTLTRCRLTGNLASYGGGANSSTMSNCVLIGNTGGEGGGANGGALFGCTLVDNTAGNGGGAKNGTLYNCTVIGNRASSFGGGLDSGAAINCIIYHNTGAFGSNVASTACSNCCVAPLAAGIGNFTSDPMLTSLSDGHLFPNSPCINAGTNQPWMSGALDIDGEPRTNGTVDVGADEFWAGGLTGTITAAIAASQTNVLLGTPITFSSRCEGRIQGNVWLLGDGTMATNQTFVTRTYPFAGSFTVILTASNLDASAAATLTVYVADTIYVTTNGNNSASGLTWETAKRTIQGGVDAAPANISNIIVLVTNGVYNSGGIKGYPAGSPQTNRVTINKPLTVRSVNGPDVTFIVGFTNASGGARCVYMDNGATLSGFTVTNGFSYGSLADYYRYGSGIWSPINGTAVISNCIITGNSGIDNVGSGGFNGYYYNCVFRGNRATNPSGIGGAGAGGADGKYYNCTFENNSAAQSGGAVYEGTLINCLLVSNSANLGGGAFASSLTNCVLIGNTAITAGGGAGTGDNSSGSRMDHCVLIRNSCAGSGGGSSRMNLINCLVAGNAAAGNGGGAYGGTLNNCTVVSNTAAIGGGVYPYGGANITLKNCIVYSNSATNNSPNHTGATFNFSCTTPLPAGPGNITNSPLFVDQPAGNFRLARGSPCINTGSNGYVQGQTDVDGNLRIQSGTVDMGAYEFAGIPADWLTKYGLPLDGSVDYTDSDLDGFIAWQEYWADTNPTNSQSFLGVTSPQIAGGSTAGLVISWQSVTGRTYRLDRTTNLADTSFADLGLSVTGQPIRTSATDATATAAGLYFYRVRTSYP